MSELEVRVQTLEKKLEKLIKMFSPLDLHAQAKDKMIKAIKKHKKFRSKRQWALYAKVSMDTFYRLEKEVIVELEREGYKVIYKPISSKKNSHIYRFDIQLAS